MEKPAPLYGTGLTAFCFSTSQYGIAAAAIPAAGPGSYRQRAEARFAEKEKSTPTAWLPVFSDRCESKAHPERSCRPNRPVMLVKTISCL